MEIVIRSIDKKDFPQIQRFASQGMQISAYTENKLELWLYAKYFWYLELNRATRVLAAYIGERLAGVPLADMVGEPKVSVSRWRGQYVRFVEWVMSIGYKDASDYYDAANKELLAGFREEHHPEGELNFFAVDPNLNGRGIGSKLLDELVSREKGKLIYLFTNTGYSYQFYDRKGFEKPSTRSIAIAVHGKAIPHDCFLYSKTL